MVDNRRDVLKFIRYYAISTGDIEITSYTIYYVYCLWKKTDRVSLRMFTHNLQLIFPLHKIGHKRFFKLSNFPQHLTAKTIKEEREFLKKCIKGNRKRYDKKKKQKTKTRSSSTQSLC